MDAARVTTVAAGLHVGLAGAAIYYTTQIKNDVRLSEVSAKELAVMGGIALLPVLSAWIGLRLARTGAARCLMAIGQATALLLFAATFVVVVRSAEPMAPLMFLLVSLWLAAGLSIFTVRRVARWAAPRLRLLPRGGLHEAIENLTDLG